MLGSLRTLEPMALTENSNRKELLRLRRVAESISLTRAETRKWLKLTQDGLDSPELEQSAGDQILVNCAGQLKRLLQSRAIPLVDAPPKRRYKKSELTSLPQNPFEANLGEQLPDSWVSETVLFRNEMAAQAGILLAIQDMCRPTSAAPLLVSSWVGHAPTRSLLIHRERASVQPTPVGSQSVLNMMSHAGILVWETVRRDHTLEVWDMNCALKNWSGGAPRFLVVDTSLSGRRFPLNQFLQRLQRSQRPPTLVFQVRSHESADAGVVTVYAMDNGVTGNVGRLLRLVRHVSGSELSAEKVTLLAQAALYASEAQCREDAVVENNAALARRLYQCKEICESIVHPCLSSLSSADWAVAPHVYLHLRDGVGEHLFQKLVDECRRRGLPFGVNQGQYNGLQLVHGNLKISLGPAVSSTSVEFAELLEGLVKTDGH